MYCASSACTLDVGVHFAGYCGSELGAYNRVAQVCGIMPWSASFECPRISLITKTYSVKVRRLCRGVCFGEPGITAEDRKEIVEDVESEEADPEAPPTPEVSDPVLGAHLVAPTDD